MSLKVLFSLVILFVATGSRAQGSTDYKKIVFIGDSLTEGYNIAKENAYPALIQNKIDSKKLPYKVINGGVSGSTTASAVSRLKWFLKSKPEIVVIALGANDGLRGVKLKQSRKNLEQAIKLAQDNKARVLLLGMRIPPNYGKEYTENFEKMYTELAKKFSIPLMPFMLKDVAAKKELNLSDQIHPNEEGYKILAKNIYVHLEKLL